MLGGCDTSGRSEWEKKNEQTHELPTEDPIPPFPPIPKRADLLEFEVSPPQGFRYYIDGASLNVDAKGVIRYVMVVRSTSGSENVTFEAMRCKSDEYRVYALGRADGTWGGRPGNWQQISESRQFQHRTLRRQYFCPQSNPIASADEGRRALRDGGNPWAKGFSGDALRGQ